MKPRPPHRVGFIDFISASAPAVDRFPYNIPAVRKLRNIRLHPAVTFLVGENGSGKSTIIEAIAVRLSFEELGGSAITGDHNLFDHRDLDGGLHDVLQIKMNSFRHPADRFFMRAETVFDLANKLDTLEKEYPNGYRRYGGKSLHSRSHGEAFLALIQNRMIDESLIILDEPEAALSPSRQLTFLKELDWLVRCGCQFIIATHSPILMAYPDSQILLLDENGIAPIAYEETEHYTLTKNFLNRPESYLRHLIE
jgi:predicted ATPase